MLPRLLFLLLLSAGFGFAFSSTIGIGYISRLLEIQDRERAPASVQVAAARDVLRRVLPHLYSSFEFRIIPKETCDGDFCFIIKNHPFNAQPGAPEILISGVTGVEIVAGLHWYLKYHCGSHISWDKTGGFQTPLLLKSGRLPRVQDAGMVVRRPVPWSYYQNAVTSSYTFAWWDWERWEKEIDWMALQGINLPLAFTGQESIWQKVFLRFNISTAELDDFFGGPAFLAWSRMANLHGWGGPLPQSWLDQQLLIQKKILSRMYELGMTPVLPAFSGSIPAALKQKFPSAKITRLGNWFSVDSNPRWCCTYLLDATDPLFVEIGRAFIEEQIKEYGRTGHIYNCDTFDENTPPEDDPGFISSLGAATYEGMKSGDPDAVWLMQGWLFSYDPFWKPPQMKALLHSVPLGRMVVLDLFAEVKPIWTTSEQFYGVPYIWCMLHNFAGNVEMYGVLDSVASGPVEARTSENSSMTAAFGKNALSLAAGASYQNTHHIQYGFGHLKVGVGMSMEGIEQNPVVYDLMSEMAFQMEKVYVPRWINLYAARRYGQLVPSVSEAWNILYHTIYNCTDGLYDKNRDVIVAFPDVDPSSISFLQLRYQHRSDQFAQGAVTDDTSNLFDKPHLWYSTAEVVKALELFLESGEYLQGSSCYRYDLIDLTRQALAKYANQLFVEIIEAYQIKDADGVIFKSQKFLDLVEDLDTLLACHEGFLLGPWLESSKRLAQNKEQKIQYEWNARTQITMWYDNTEEEASLLRDYGNKYWSGLLRDYYGPRAALYFNNLKESLEKGHDFQLKKWRKEWIKLTNDWQNSRNVFPIKSAGNALLISQQLFNKYLRESYP